jgi:hypothetical protein
VQDHRKAPRDRDLCPTHAPPLRNLHPPSFEPAPRPHSAKQYRRGFAEQGTYHPVSASCDPAVSIGLSRGVFARCQAEVCSEQRRFPEPTWFFDSSPIREGRYRPHPRHAHQPTADRI